jgi:hypothetical protein
MQVRITAPVYKCAPEGHTVFRYQQGDIVTGRVADLALSDGAGQVIAHDLETKITPPAEKKIPRTYRRKAKP